jgi:hypothetical protein
MVAAVALFLLAADPAAAQSRPDVGLKADIAASVAPLTP